MDSVHRWRRARLGAYGRAWAFLLSAVVCATAGFVINKAAGNPSRLSKPALLEIGGTVLVLWGIAVVLLLFSISRFSRARYAPRLERDRATARQVAAEHLGNARRLVLQLLAGEIPAGERVWDVVLAPGERVLLDGALAYSRFYGASSPVSYTHVRTRHYGRVGFARMLFDHGLDHAGNRRRAEAAAYAAQTRWRDQQQSRVVVSDRRLLCQIRTKEWLTFEHAAVTAVKALPEAPSVVLEYHGTAPLCLAGPLSAQVMVIVVWALYGADGLREHPALADVRPALPAVTVTTVRRETSGPVESEVAAEQPTGDDRHADGGPVRVADPVDLLVFVAAHELVLAGQAAALLKISLEDATGRLDELVDQGLVCRVWLSPKSPPAYQVTTSGAGRVDPALPPVRAPDLRGYRHAVGVGWLWASGRAGSFGEVREVLTRREMHAADATGRTEVLLDAPGVTFRDEPPEADGAHLDLGYPDLALVQTGGGWVSVDLVLGVPDPEQVRWQIGRAHRHGLIVRQLLLVEQDGQTRELIESTATELGLADRVHVQFLAEDGIAGD